MTETLTHVAIKPLNGPNKSDLFQALDRIHFKINERDCLVIYAPMLNSESIITNDIVELVDKSSFRWLGRFDNIINSGGIKIIPEVIEEKLASVIIDRRFYIVGETDNKLGEKVVLLVEGNETELSFQHLEKYERPKEIYFIPKFVETKSGKVNQQETINSRLNN
ncbi:MAG: hypothetical protein HOI55_05040 [Candidatus Marinimicrobia bacterium]|nr:hypothetical protein [Candidatus Neomarinimicrobiota bacterium]